MPINEYHSLEEFTSQYTGIWAPSEDHWFGLEFRCGISEYRLHTGSMFADEPTFTTDGQEILFRLYLMRHPSGSATTYHFQAHFPSMNDLLRYTGIDNRPFSDVITDASTTILGKD